MLAALARSRDRTFALGLKFGAKFSDTARHAIRDDPKMGPKMGNIRKKKIRAIIKKRPGPKPKAFESFELGGRSNMEGAGRLPVLLPHGTDQLWVASGRLIRF